MPNNKVKTTKALQSKKTKIASRGVHPNSRRAKQLQRVELRTKKLEVHGKVRRVQEVHEGAPPSLPRPLRRSTLPLRARLTSAPLSAQSTASCTLSTPSPTTRRRSRSPSCTTSCTATCTATRPSSSTSLTSASRAPTGARPRARASARRNSRSCARRRRASTAAGLVRRSVPLLPRARTSRLTRSRPLAVLPDLTIPENVELCRQWVRPAPSKEGKNAKGGDPSFLGRSVLPSLPPRLERPALTPPPLSLQDPPRAHLFRGQERRRRRAEGRARGVGRG